MHSFFRKKECVIFDVKSLNVTYYRNGKLQENGFVKSLNEFIKWCSENLSPEACIVLLGTNQIDGLFSYLEHFRFNICCYDINLHTYQRVANNNQNSTNDILNAVNEIKTLLKREQPKNSNYSLFNTSSPQYDTKEIKELKSFLVELFEGLNKKQSETQYLVSEIYNRDAETSNNGSIEIIDDLRKELAAYKNDFYQKSMLNFGVNTAIEILERLYTERNLLKQSTNIDGELDRITKIISFCEIKIKKLNLKVSYSSEGDEFDSSRMITYDDKVSTDNEDLKDCVAYSISPAIYWTLPRVNAPGEDELLIKEETVALYE